MPEPTKDRADVVERLRDVALLIKWAIKLGPAAEVTWEQGAADAVTDAADEIETLRAALADLEGAMYSQTQKLAGLGPVACDYCDAVFEREITIEGHEPECVVRAARAVLEQG